MKSITLLSLMLAAPVLSQQVTISSQPGIVLIATFGAKLPLSVYSAEVCSSPGVNLSSSWGQIRQIAEMNGINIVDPVLVAPTAQLAEGKTNTHRAVIIIGYVGLAAAFAGVFHRAPPWLIEAGTTVSGGAEVLGPMFTANEARVQQTIQSALGALADPTAQFSISNGACVSSRLLLGQTIKNFVPIKAILPSTASLAPPAVPNSTVPQPTSFHPAIQARDGATFETTLPMASTSEPTAYALMWMRGN